MRWIILVLMLALCVQALDEAGWDARIDAEAERQLDSLSSESSSSSSESSVDTSSILPECPSEVTVNTYFSNCDDLRTKDVNEYCYNTSHAYFKFTSVYLPVWGHSAETDNRAGSFSWNNEETIQRNDPIKSTYALKKELFEKILLTKEAYPSIGGTFVEDGTKMFVKQGAEWHMVESVTFGTPNETNGLTKTDQSIGFTYTTRAACPGDVTMLEELAQQEPVQDSDSGYSSTQIESSTTSTYPTCTYCSMLDEAWYIAGNSQVYIPGTGLAGYTTVYPPVTTSTFASAMTADCSGMVDKLYLAAQDMKTWDRDSWDNPDPCGNNACCSMNEQVDGRRACSIGMPGSTCGSAKGCCGAYIWHLFDIAIHKHGVAMQWPYKGEGSTENKPNSFWPGNMVGVQKIQLREKGQVVEGNPDVHSNLKPGDLLYLQWENDDDNTGCQYNSHVLMVGKAKDDSFEYVDSGNYRNGVSRSTVRDYLDYRQECGARIQRKDSPRVWIWRSPLCI